MHLRLLAEQVLDAAADAHTFACAVRDTRAVDSAFASFFLCDWETLERRQVPWSVYAQLKFGCCASTVGNWLPRPLTSKAAPLADGGCAVLEPVGGALHLFRPDGSHGASFPLLYGDIPAYDLIAAGEDLLWFTVPDRGALVRYSINRREITLRVGGTDTFPLPHGLTRNADTLWVCCAGSDEAKAFSMPDLEITETLPFRAPPEKLFRVYSRVFVWLADGSVCAVE